MLPYKYQIGDLVQVRDLDHLIGYGLECRIGRIGKVIELTFMGITVEFTEINYDGDTQDSFYSDEVTLVYSV